jgi:hypothetical protein
VYGVGSEGVGFRESLVRFVVVGDAGTERREGGLSLFCLGRESLNLVRGDADGGLGSRCSNRYSLCSNLVTVRLAFPTFSLTDS